MKEVILLFSALVVLFETTNSLPATCEDRIPHQCSVELQPHYCYLEHNRQLCCKTCRRHETGNPECLYGDHYTRIVRKDASGTSTTYNCEGYIGFFGPYHCENEPKFREYCCQTCKLQQLQPQK